MTNLTDADLAAMKARADAATLGPWRIEGQEIVGRSMATRVLQDTWVADIDSLGADAEFIAHAREDVPDLLVEVAALRNQIDLADKAPHDPSCKYGSFFATTRDDPRPNGGPIPCTCWKAEYDAERKATHD